MTNATPPSTDASYGQRATRGVMWTGLYQIIARFTSVIAQWVLGYKLSEGDFGLYAIAMSASALVLSFGRTGLDRFLIQRGDEYERIARPVWRVGLAADSAAALALVALAPVILRFYDEPRLAPLIWIIAISIPLRTPSKMLRAKLSVDLRFRENALISTISVVLRHTLTIVFALAGLGPLSFVLPIPCIVVYEAIHAGLLMGWIPRTGRLTRELLLQIINAGKWMILAGVAVTLIVQGDYMVVGKLEDRHTTGQYYFAFQLTIAVAATLLESVAAVMLPALARLRHDASRLRQAYTRSLRLMTLLAAPITAGTYLVIAPAIHVLWQGKWDAVAFAAQMLAIALLFRFHLSLAVSLIEACGRWRLRAVLLLGDGLGTLGSAVLGAWLGGLDTIAVVVTAYRLASGLLMTVAGSRLAGLSAGATLATMAPAVAVAGMLAALVAVLFAVIVPVTNPWLQIVLPGGTFAIAYLLAAYWRFRAQIDDLRSLLFGR